MRLPVGPGPDVRPYRLARSALAVCGRCFAGEPGRRLDYDLDVLQGTLVEQDGRILLRRHCRRGHGEIVSLYEEDAELWRGFQAWRVPTRALNPDTDDPAPIPMGYRNGLGPLQEQHTCVLLVDLTEDCNISCPICFAGSRPGIDRYARPEHVLATVDRALEREGGQLDLVMLSGGEPTLHPALASVLEEILERPVTRVIVNTNGIRVARDDALLEVLRRNRKRVEVYLQHDGPSADASLALRGADLTRVREQAVARLARARVFTTLAMAVDLGVNDADVGAVAELALATDYVGGVVFQPRFGVDVDPLDRITATGIVRRLEAQTGGRLKAADFIGLPCSHPDCTLITYLVRLDGGDWRSIPDLVGLDALRAHLGLVGNRLVPDDRMWAALAGLFSESMTVSRPDLIRHISTLADTCRLDLGGFVRVLGRSVLGRRDGIEAATRRVKRFTVRAFMDPWTLDVERLRQCCTHVGSVGDASPVRVPFCARTVLGELRERTNGGLVPVARLLGE